MDDIVLTLPRPHAAQRQIISESRRFNVVSCGRRWGKSTLGINRILRPALEGSPVAWFCPTYKNLAETWRELQRLLQPVTLRSNAQERRLDLLSGGVVEMWSLDSPVVIRGRHYARLVVDEAAQIDDLQDSWEQIIRSTLADLQGDAWFLSTPRGFNFFKLMFDHGQDAAFPDWASWQMPTHTNPHIQRAELVALERELSSRIYRQEILAVFEEDQQGTLWHRSWIDAARVTEAPEAHLITRICVAVDPAASSQGAETGIVVAALARNGHGYILADRTVRGSPDTWATAAVRAYTDYAADVLVAEKNQGGEMVAAVLGTAKGAPPVKLVHASRGKQTRAEPVARLYEQGRVHHVGGFPQLEQQMVSWVPGEDSPDRMDALVWCISELMLGAGDVEPLDADLMAALAGYTGY